MTLFAFACGSSAVPGIRDLGSASRWPMLFVLLGVAVVWAVVERPRTRPVWTPYAIAAAFVVLALLSSFWSVDPRLTFQRAVSLGVLFAGAGLFGLVAAERSEAVVAVLAGVVVGSVVVAVAGIAVFVFDRQDAVQYNGEGSFDRFRGLGENPNTVPMLFALAIPIVAWTAISARGALRRLGVGAFFLLAASIVVSESRGGLLGAVAALTVAALLAPGSLARRFATVVVISFVVAGGFLVSNALTPSTQREPGVVSVSQPLDTTAPAPAYQASAATLVPFIPRADEFGRPAFGGDQESSRSRFRTSGRFGAWRMAVEQGAERPLLGFGFGTEERVFVDRLYVLQSGRPENSYVGLFLQLGGAGAVLFLAFALSLAWHGLRTFRRLRGAERAQLALLMAVLGAGLVLALVQSYVYSVGNVATVTFWLSAFLLSGTAARARSGGSTIGEARRSE